MRIQWIGLPTDVNSSYRRGAAAGPAAIRSAWQRLLDFGNGATERGQELDQDFRIDDLGDLDLRESPDDHATIVAHVLARAERGPTLCVGGDHSVTYPIVEALARIHGPLNILHFDAHPDLYDDFGGNPRSHASPFARILERGLARRLVQVGVRTWNAHNRAQAARFGVEVVPWEAFAPERVPIPDDGPLYVSVDLDAFDPAFAPAVSHPEPAGLSSREVVAVITRLQGLVGADVVELNPLCGQGDQTAVLAAKLAKELCAAMVRGSGAQKNVRTASTTS